MSTIALAKNYTSLLDEAFQAESVTARLNGDPKFTREGASVNEIYYPQIATDGLGDYLRQASNAYPENAVSISWKHAQFNYDRGTKISVDKMDDQETFNIAMGMAGRELQRTKVAPEADAFTFATLAGLAGVTAPEEANITSADDFLSALLDALNRMDEDEVPAEGRYLFATPSLVNSLMSLETYKSQQAVEAFAEVVKVPKKRFVSAIDLRSGRAEDSNLGGYVPASGAKYLNFMVVYKPALIKYDKHVANNLILPENNPDADAYILKYRKYGIVDAYENQRAGIYVHTSNTPASTGSN